MRNILFSGNIKVFDGILTCMLSIFMRTRSDELYRFYIFTMDVSHLRADFVPVSDEQITFLDDVAKSYNKANEVIKIDVTGYEYAAARDHYGKYLLNPNYINAGVLLLNMKQIKQTGLFEKARTLIRTKKLLFADQDAIYKSTTRKKMLPQRFNDQKFLHDHTIVRHFS